LSLDAAEHHSYGGGRLLLRSFLLVVGRPKDLPFPAAVRLRPNRPAPGLVRGAPPAAEAVHAADDAIVVAGARLHPHPDLDGEIPIALQRLYLTEIDGVAIHRRTGQIQATAHHPLAEIGRFGGRT